MKICWVLALAGSFLASCDTAPDKEARVLESARSRKVDYIRKIPGEDEEIDKDIIRRGQVLIGYSDCYTCHRDNDRARGPAFADIAARYPAQQVFIEILAARVIQGGTGAWGTTTMIPHPKLSPEDAEAMVSYILSLDLEQR